MPNGRIEPRQAKRLEEMGNWLKIYGESVYETIGGPYMPNDWLASTRKENQVYLHLLNYEKEQVELPLPDHYKVTGCSVLNEKELDFRHHSGILQIMLPSSSKSMVTVVKVTLGQPAKEIATMEI
jgi:alpha-L-fucosidase